ncbi:MAG: archease [bacterium]|nr:archease [bacterium]
MGYETFDTTADVGIRISGKNFRQLLQNAVSGLNLLFFDAPGLAGTDIKSGNSIDIVKSNRHLFRFQGDSRENLLVNFLAEALYLLQTHEQFTIFLDIEELHDNFLEVYFHTVHYTIQPAMEIKSVTYHNLEVKEKGGELSAEVIMDV